MNEGYIKLYRQIIESKIWSKPPLYLKVWSFILMKAQYQEYKNLKAGQLFISIPEIIEGVKWNIGARVERPTKDQIFNILHFLRNPCEGGNESPMIETTKATQGMLVTVLNYSKFQENDERESNDENNTKATRRRRKADNINKENKEDKKSKGDKESYPAPSLDEVKAFFDQKGYTEASAIKAFNHYDLANKDGQWYDANGNIVKNWKQKMNSVWFKEDNLKPSQEATIVPLVTSQEFFGVAINYGK